MITFRDGEETKETTRNTQLRQEEKFHLTVKAIKVVLNIALFLTSSLGSLYTIEAP